MPCHVELTEAELEANRRARTEKEIAKVVEPLQKRNNDLTHENDQLREAILNIVTVLGSDAENLVPSAFFKKIQKNQVEHRKEDLRRLDETFRAYLWAAVAEQGTAAFTTKDFQDTMVRIHAVQDADPNEPLEPQLGFDPDEY